MMTTMLKEASFWVFLVAGGMAICAVGFYIGLIVMSRVSTVQAAPS